MENEELTHMEDPLWLTVVITGFSCPPDDVTRIVGIPPTKMWLCGDPVSQRAWIRHSSNGWKLKLAKAPQSVVLDDFVTALLKMLPSTESFLRLPPDASVKVFCTILERRIVLKLFPGTMNELARIRATLEIDYQSDSSLPASDASEDT